ncbi:carboxyl-terminal processing protease [Pedobacter sp. UYP24]
MKNIHFKNWVLLTAMSLFVMLSACKKNKTPGPTAPPMPTIGSNLKQTPTTNRMELSNDSLFLYAKEIYFWNESLPTYDAFEPRKYNTSGSTLLNLESNLFSLVKAAAKPDYVSTSSYPKYSFIQDISTINPKPIASVPQTQASVDLEGNGNDVGIYAISAVGINATTYKLYIQAVFENSPAFKAGLTRGAYITEINGTQVGTVNNGDISSSERTLINSTIYANPTTITLKGFKTDGTAFDVTLTKASYKSSPIYKSNILTAGTHKIGYIAYARFSNASNSIAALTSVFNDFAAKGVTDLVVDLRYNGGGYVSTAETLTNLIAPSSATGTMYVEYYNNNLRNRRTTDPSILKNQPLLDDNDKLRYGSDGKIVTYADLDYSVAGNTNSFSKQGDLKTVTNIVFIVSGRTASASELVINNLKPKMTVSLVGKTTYGKPIGFFPFRLENKYDVYLSLFESKNSAGQGEYYTGMVPDVDGGTDLGDYDWGNPLDGYLAKAVNIIAPGIKGVISANRLSGATGTKNNLTLSVLGNFENDKEFVGMIEDKPKIKK